MVGEVQRQEVVLVTVPQCLGDEGARGWRHGAFPRVAGGRARRRRRRAATARARSARGRGCP
eukprot:7490563-Heterocapsa_arctica.AAC.1